MLLALRRRADALIVGPGTVRAEGYGPLPCPAVLVSRSFDLPWEAGLFAAPGQRVLVYTRAEGEPPAVAADVEMVPQDGARRDVLADLRARGRRAAAVRGRADAQPRAARRGSARRALPHALAGRERRRRAARDRRRAARASAAARAALGRHRRRRALPALQRVGSARHADRGSQRPGGRRRVGARRGDRAAAAREAGAKVTIADLNAEKGEALAEELGATLRAAATSPSPSRSRPRSPPRATTCGSPSAAPASAGPRRSPASAARTSSSRSGSRSRST